MLHEDHFDNYNEKLLIWIRTAIVIGFCHFIWCAIMFTILYMLAINIEESSCTVYKIGIRNTTYYLQ